MAIARHRVFARAYRDGYDGDTVQMTAGHLEQQSRQFEAGNFWNSLRGEKAKL